MIESKGEKEKIQSILNDRMGGEFPLLFTEDQTRHIRKFHRSIEAYEETPLVSLDDLARELGVAKIFIKDESSRFGLNAFKALGGTYGMAKILCKKLGVKLEDVDFNYLKSREAKERIGKITFATATDGNHGKGVAWAAKQLDQSAVVYLPKGAAKRRVEAIIEEGAQAYVTDLNFDDTVRLAFKEAKKNGWYAIQDTSWEGYEEIPAWIMQGYTTMGEEALDQMKLEGVLKPSHLFLQAGVGGMAGAILGYYVNKFQGNHCKTIIIEPDNAACIYKSAQAGDGKPHSVTGDLETIMAGLSCGDPHPIGWEILRDFASAFMTCPDYIAARGMRILANPLGEDKKVIAGESGAVGVGLLSLLMQRPELRKIKDDLGIHADSTILIFNTEGDTDPVNYRSIVWDGKYPI